MSQLKDIAIGDVVTISADRTGERRQRTVTQVNDKSFWCGWDRFRKSDGLLVGSAYPRQWANAYNVEKQAS